MARAKNPLSDVTTQLIIGGVAAAALGGGLWWLSTRPADSREKNDQVDSQKAAETELKKLEASGSKQGKVTKSDATFSRIADGIAQSLTGWLVDNKDRAESLLKEVNTDADFEKLQVVYGVRDLANAFGQKTGPYNLAQTITKELYSNQIARINALYQQRGMSRRW